MGFDPGVALSYQRWLSTGDLEALAEAIDDTAPLAEGFGLATAHAAATDLRTVTSSLASLRGSLSESVPDTHARCHIATFLRPLVDGAADMLAPKFLTPWAVNRQARPLAVRMHHARAHLAYAGSLLVVPGSPEGAHLPARIALAHSPTIRFATAAPLAALSRGLKRVGRAGYNAPDAGALALLLAAIAHAAKNTALLLAFQETGITAILYFGGKTYDAGGYLPWDSRWWDVALALTHAFHALLAVSEAAQNIAE